MCPGLTQHAYWCVCLSMWPPDCPHVAVFQPRAAAERRGCWRRCCWVSFGDSTHHSGFQQSRVHGRDCGGVKLSLTSLFTDSASREGDFPAAGVRAQNRHIQPCTSVEMLTSVDMNIIERWVEGCWCVEFPCDGLLGAYVLRNQFSG